MNIFSEALYASDNRMLFCARMCRAIEDTPENYGHSSRSFYCQRSSTTFYQQFETLRCAGVDNRKYHELHTQHGGLPRTSDVLAYLARQLRTWKAQGLVLGPASDNGPADWRKVRDTTFC